MLVFIVLVALTVLIVGVDFLSTRLVDTGPVTFFFASVAYGVTSRAVVLSPGVVSATEFTFTLLALLNEVNVCFSATLGFRELFHM